MSPVARRFLDEVVSTEPTSALSPGSSKSADALRKRIVFLIPGLNVGGAERHTVDLRARLGEAGFDTSLIVYGRKRSPAVVNHPGAAKALYLDLKGMSDLFGWWTVHKEFRRQNADMIIAINQMPLIVAILTRLFGGTRAKIACIFHTTVLSYSEQRLFFLFRWAARFADALIFVSAHQKMYWAARGLTCRNTSVIPNGVDLDRFDTPPTQKANVRSCLGFEEDDLVLGLVAAFRQEKNHSLLVQAVSVLRFRGVRAKIMFVGDGPTRPAVEALVTQLGLDEHVAFVGEQSDVRHYVAACDIGILCSTTETMPLAAIEFLAMGLPLVMSNVGGASEIIDDGLNGLLFESENLNDFVRQLVELVPASRRRTMAAFARSSRVRFSAIGMIARYEALIKDLLEASEPGPTSRRLHDDL